MKKAMLGILLAAVTLVALAQSANPLVGSAPVTASVTNSSATVLAANLGRRGFVCVNVGTTNPLSLGFGQAAVASSGITLSANGGAVSWLSDTVTKQSVTAISTSGTTISCQEFQ